MSRVPMLDLFSGIGGFSLALRSGCRTIAYCEIDEVCQDVLKTNMQRGLLDVARIHPDIRTLEAKSLWRFKPQAVAMGSPCQDISAAGDGEGVFGPQSSLIFDALRVVAELPTIRWILMENSPFIIRRGLEDVETELKKMGFRLHSTILAAADVGAPHLRKRWFGLAWRNAPPTLPIVDAQFQWRSEPVPRLMSYVSRLQGKKLRARNRILGNAAVPQCVKVAFLILVGQMQDPKVLPRLFRHAKLKLVLQDQGIKYIKTMWGTPCASPRLWYISNLSDRNSRVITNQLYYEKGSKELRNRLEAQKGWIVANPNFIEWLQGFPQDWTTIN